MEFVAISSMPKEAKISLLTKLGYGSDGIYVLDSKGRRVVDKYVDVEVQLSRMMIFPGSAIIFDDNPLSLASYLDEYNRDDI